MARAERKARNARKGGQAKSGRPRSKTRVGTGTWDRGQETDASVPCPLSPVPAGRRFERYLRMLSFRAFGYLLSRRLSYARSV